MTFSCVMIEFFHVAALAGGSGVAAKLAVRRPRNIEQLIAELDMKLVARLIEASDDDEAMVRAWRDVSLVEMDRQARILTRIAVEFAKLEPEKFSTCMTDQKRCLTLFRWAETITLIERVCFWLRPESKRSRIHAVVSVRSFTRLFNAAEMMIVNFDSAHGAMG